ncbi:MULTISPECIES: preprotein translocase subunit SecG [Rhodopseudomonas]|jgi:preprotein translocase subunit SecG|uniref:Protein-export membrane protein SecG n=1 Tax=Rhodopseudomonas palustris (strain DX-1) TaxID=652103 RepID=E6VHK9_RHOPX|nr:MULTISPECIES: preprotein translocase subunit SecG [Rhodopseudomonas]NEW88103.1 preprotein translocase subunit SecG [Rhodopseudomonas sp. WA056]QDL97579.1 preprotein translocase subunit SecG [Rhodopseudomonas palustris]
MQTVIIVIHLMLVLGLIGVVLLQKSEGGGLGVGGGGGGGFMSSRGTANLLTRTTAILAVGFFITSLLLTWLASYNRKPTTILPTAPIQQQVPGQPAPPVSQGGGLLDTLRQTDQQQNQQPAAPAAPAAPTPPQSQ